MARNLIPKSLYLNLSNICFNNKYGTALVKQDTTEYYIRELKGRQKTISVELINETYKEIK